jgi:N-acetylmuramoyl-L-alanine amidase
MNHSKSYTISLLAATILLALIFSIVPRGSVAGSQIPFPTEATPSIISTPSGEGASLETDPGVLAPDAAMAAFANALAGKKVTLDPGHGWSGDPGSSGNGMYEKDVTLDVARRVKTILEGQGISVTMTRNGDEPNYGLVESENRANRYGADIVVAIHTNAGAGATGTESCYVVNKSTSASSLSLARYLTNSVSSKFALTKRGDFPENSTSRCVRGRWSPPYLYIHWMTPVTALVETAFINGAAKDVDILKNKRQELADAIASGIASYFGETITTRCSIPSGQFCGEFYNNRTLSGSPSVKQNTTSINYDWGTGSPVSGIGVDNFSVRWQGTYAFDNATYSFTTTTDDGMNLYVDNVKKSPTSPAQDPWRDQAPTTYSYDLPMTTGNHTIKVEYYENGGGAVARVAWQKKAALTYGSSWVSQSGYPTVTQGGSADLWVTYQNTGTATWTNTYSPNRTHLGTLHPTTGAVDYASPFVCTPSWVGNNRPAILSEASVAKGANGTFRFKICVPSNMTPGTYRIAVAPLVENVSWMKSPQFVYWDVTVQAAGTSSGNLALNKPTWTTSTENSNFPSYKGNDGNTGTRWSSGSSGDQWWRVDLGSAQTFDKVIIRWEAAYAATHWIAWSNDDYNYSYYSFSIPSSGSYAYNIGSRTFRYVAVIMKTRAPCCGNFSFWEFEVYRTTAASPWKYPRGVELLNPDGEMNTIQMPEELIPVEVPEMAPEVTPEVPTPTGN